MHDLWRLWHTVRHLRATQIYGRVLYRLRKPRVNAASAPLPNVATGVWQAPCAREASLIGPVRLRLLEVDRVIEGAADWNRPDWPKLWLYNAHYFDDLNALNAAQRRQWQRELIARWIVENPPGQGNGWEPYPLSLRVVNWIKWAQAGNVLEPTWLDSLAVQVRWLMQRLEWHLLGNHLFGNAKALVFAGLFFDGAEAVGWLREGLRILDREVPEQILADGGQFERSPMYHALALEDVLDLVNAAARWPGRVDEAHSSAWRRTAVGMLAWMRTMTHPDGGIALFNDAALDIAPTLEDLQGYARRLGVIAPASADSKMIHLLDSGYLRAECGPALALLDVGPIGPDYLPGHAHADTLSFELSLFGQRWIVDPGCSTYETGAERLRQRGTAAHNTVCVDGEDSSEVWSSFRVARRAYPLDLRTEEIDAAVTVACAHDGYCRLPGRVTHHRRWCLDAHGMTIEDALQGRYRSAAAGLLLHPQVGIVDTDASTALLRRDGHEVRVSVIGGELSVVPASWHPRFGTALVTRRLRIDFTQARVSCRLDW